MAFSRLFSHFFLRRVLHFKGHLICQILANMMKINSGSWVRLIFRSSYTSNIRCIYIYSPGQTELVSLARQFV